MARLDHRDMTPSERARVEQAAHEERVVEPGWSSHTAAVMILILGSFVAGVVLFGLPASMLIPTGEDPHVRDLVLFTPGVLTLLVGGLWSIVYYLRGYWRVRRELMDDLDYGRVEVVSGHARDAWVIDGEAGSTWLLDLEDEVLLLAPSAVPQASPRTFPGRMVRVVRCKHSGMVLDIELAGPALAPTGRLRAREVQPSALLQSARYDGALDEVCRAVLLAA